MGSPKRTDILAHLQHSHSHDGENHNLGLDIDDYDYDMFLSSTLPPAPPLPVRGLSPGLSPDTGAGAVDFGGPNQSTSNTGAFAFLT